MFTSEKPLPLAVLQGRAKVRVSAQPAVQEERASTDVMAFCTLLARILMRCLKEQDEQALHVLSLPSKQDRKE